MRKIFSALLFLLAFATNCAKSGGLTVNNTSPTLPVTITPLINLPAGWKMATSFMSAFPQGIQLFSYDTIFNDQKIKAFCLVYDSKNTAIEFKPTTSIVAKTPADFFATENGTTYACINGGFFGGNQSYSLVKYNNVVYAPNIKAITRIYNGNNTSYYPTRAAFGITPTGDPTVAWIYHVGSTNDNMYSYPLPSPNDINFAPQIIPNESFPAGGSVWNVVSAIGGSPVLMKNNNIQISDKEEMIVIDNGIPRARSAIGYTSDKKILIVAVEGDNPGVSAGLNLNNLALLMKSLGCTEAINLDGGGSTSFVVNNLKTVRPSDNGTERQVASAILIKKK